MRFIVFGGSAVLIAIAFYIVFSRNMTAANLTAYAYFYDKGYIGLGNTFSENLAILARLLSFLIEFWQPYDQILNYIFLGRTPGIAYALQLSVAVVFFSVIAVAFVFCAVRSTFIAISLASTFALIIVLNAVHILPIVVPRYLFFAAPLLYLVLGVGLGRRLSPDYVELFSKNRTWNTLVFDCVDCDYLRNRKRTFRNLEKGRYLIVALENSH